MDYRHVFLGRWMVMTLCRGQERGNGIGDEGEMVVEIGLASWVGMTGRITLGYCVEALVVTSSHF